MAGWLRKITAKPGDLMVIAEAIAHYEGVYEDGMLALNPAGRLWDTAKALPGWQAYFYGQYREIEAIMAHLKNREAKAYGTAVKLYLENYTGRALSEAMARKYAEGDLNVLEAKEVQIEFQLLFEKFAGLTKGLESLHFQMTNLVALRKAGIEDATF
jgi:hypothetical protein